MRGIETKFNQVTLNPSAVTEAYLDSKIISIIKRDEADTEEPYLQDTKCLLQHTVHSNMSIRKLAEPFLTHSTQDWHMFFPGLEFKDVQLIKHPERLSEYSARKKGIEEEYSTYKYLTEISENLIIIIGELKGDSAVFEKLRWKLEFHQENLNSKFSITTNYKLKGNGITCSFKNYLLFNPLIIHALSVLAHRLQRFQTDPQSFSIYENLIEVSENNQAIQMSCNVTNSPNEMFDLLRDKKSLEKILKGCEVNDDLSFNKPFPTLTKNSQLQFGEPKLNQNVLQWKSKSCLPLTSVYMTHQLLHETRKHQLRIEFNPIPGAPSQAKQIFIDIFSVWAYTMMRLLIETTQQKNPMRTNPNQTLFDTSRIEPGQKAEIVQHVALPN